MACAPFSVLEITDGTTAVDLLAERSGFCCTDWTPAIAEGKGGGVWRDSPLSGGRRLAMRKLGNVIERYELQVRDWNQDQLARDTQRLRRLLEKAITYWTSRWQDEPVWIVAQSPLEENPRYALVHNYSTPGDGFPYGQPFWPQIGSAAMDNFTLLLEQGHWTENEPGTGTAVECSAVETYDGRNLGNVDSTGARAPTTANEVYIANKRNEANLTDIYHWDASAAAWSANLLDAALPFAFLPAVPAVGDYIYFGIDTAVADSGPFCSLVFDIGTVQVDLTLVWYYWNGGHTVIPEVQDNTDAAGAMTGEPFDTTGVNSVHWVQPSDWVPVANNGITAYWVYAKVTAIGGAPAPPQQQNRDIYTVIWPYVEVQDTQILGDIPALYQAKLHNRSGCYTGTHTYRLQAGRIIMGLRSISRGSDFTAYINLADEQNPTGITVGVGALTAFANDTTSPTGRRITYTSGAIRPLQRNINIDLDSTINPDFYGTYHAFLRCFQPIGGGVFAGDIGAQLQVDIAFGGELEEYSEIAYTYATGMFNALDLGQIHIPPTDCGADDIFDEITLYIWLSSAHAAAVLYLYDLILIPVDENALDLGGPLTDTPTWQIDYRRYADVDSITRPKAKVVETFIRSASNDYITGLLIPKANGPAILQANAQQRWWHLAGRSLTEVIEYSPETVFSIQAFRNARYLSMRGDR